MRFTLLVLCACGATAAAPIANHRATDECDHYAANVAATETDTPRVAAGCRVHASELHRDPIEECAFTAPDPQAVHECRSAIACAAAERDVLAVDTANAELAKVQAQAEALSQAVDHAVADVANASSDAARAAAKQQLATLQHDRQELEARLQLAREAAAHAARSHAMHIPKECTENPLAKCCW